MKLIVCLSFLAVNSMAVAQPKLVTQAVISTTTNMIAPEEDDLQSVQNSGGGGNFFRNFGDGETKSTTYLKNDMVKTVLKTDMGRSTIIRNNQTRLTTTLMEMMGRKTGFFITDQEQADMRKRMDSMMQSRSKDSAGRTKSISNITTKVEIINTAETKKIAGYNCKKAYVTRASLLGKDSIEIWYTPEIKMKDLPFTGGPSGFGNMSFLAAPTDLDGFVMQYEMKMPRGRIMQVAVTKIELDKEIKDKEFDIPKDFEVKPMKEMQNMMRGQGPGGNMQIRVGG